MAGCSTSDTFTSQQNVAVNSTSSKSKDSTKKKAPTVAAKAKTTKPNIIRTVVENFENPNKDITFSEHSGKSGTAALAETPLQLFHLMFPREIVETLVTETY